MIFRKSRAFIFMMFLHWAWGMLVKEWFKAGFPFRQDFLFLFMLTPPLMIIDGLIIYNNRKFSNKPVLISLIVCVGCFIVGLAMGWPKTAIR